ncbi:Hypothetical predicted protein [Olea europaea subsp. europaea]|uniref:Uncharacterized protein n=1 Tax=Olea europaea subsp. europaea TaxID=158383 RepID=A0A8S0QU24_OLEEU|nr:Hypothetical predicted protein [Olea europaea subsp. europaea]
MCRINREGYFKWGDHRIPHAAYKGTLGGNAISISACDDHRNSADPTVSGQEPLFLLDFLGIFLNLN